MKNTALTQKHEALGAKMVPFAGFYMPVSYTGINQEHEVVRNKVGIFDVSHMGEFMVTGPDAEKFIQYTTSNNVSKLEPGKAQYSCLPNPKGGIIDDLLVYKMTDDKYMLVVNAGNIDKDWNWLQKNAEGFDVQMKNNSDTTSLLAVQGPNAVEALQKITDIDLSLIPFYSFERSRIGGVDDVIISATGYTGSGGFELYCHNEDAEQLWDAVMEAGKEFGIKPCGLGCRDTLRLEMGYCLYGNDITDATTPLEAGLGWITKLDTGFIGSDVLKQQKEEGVDKKLVALQMEEKRAIPRQHYEIVDEDDNEIGVVTSGTQSPSVSKPIALGYVKKEYSKQGTRVFVKVRNKPAAAVVVKLPFYKPDAT